MYLGQKRNIQIRADLFFEDHAPGDLLRRGISQGGNGTMTGDRDLSGQPNGGVSVITIARVAIYDADQFFLDGRFHQIAQSSVAAGGIIEEVGIQCFSSLSDNDQIMILSADRVREGHPITVFRCHEPLTRNGHRVCA